MEERPKKSKYHKNKKKNPSAKFKGASKETPFYEKFAKKKPLRSAPPKPPKSNDTDEKKAAAPSYNLDKITKLEERKIKKESGTSTPPKQDEIRLNRFISNAGICSRREADSLILQGEIKVNGKTITELGTKVSSSDKVTHKGKILSRENHVYVLLNKPKGFITTMDDPKGRKTVMDLVSKACAERIYPVGRLDRETTGLLLFTNDGDFAKKMAHPSGRVKKIYSVELDKPFEEKDFDNLTSGEFTLEDGPVDLDGVSMISEDGTKLGIQIHSGKNRVVRRIFEHLGYQVIKLDRTVYSELTKKDLPRGKWRFLTQKEVITLKYFTGKN